MRPRRKSVALLIETSNDYARGLLHGIVAYIREHRPWSVYLAEHGRGDQPPTWLPHWRGDGIIARIENRRIARAVLASGLPTVDVSAANLIPSLPWVETDDAAIARLAFEHLMECGFRHFAFCGDANYNWSNWRSNHFQRCVGEAGRDCHVFHSAVPPRSSGEWSQRMSRIAQWVKELPKPVGIMACYDPLGRQILEACRQIDAAVPDEVAVVGVDNDELLCELADPPLSSITPDTHRTGYKAAAILDQLMSGRKVRQRIHLIEPLGLMVRESSDVQAIEDEHISTAVRYIREHALEGIDVGDVLDRIPLSRRVLETRFKKLIGRTPHEQIARVRLNRVKELLRETELPLVDIARRSGFRHVEYLSVAFGKQFGISPTTYRRQRAQSLPRLQGRRSP